MRISFLQICYSLSLLIFSFTFPQKYIHCEISKGPYLQDVRTNQITVMWETNSSPDSRVDYGPTEVYGYYKEGVAFLSHCGQYIHELVLDGLDPETFYYYQVESGGWQRPGYTFRTAPSSDAPFTFAVYGDNRSSWSNYTTFHPIVVQSIIYYTLPDLVFNVGDVVLTGDWCEETRNVGWGTEYFHPGQPLLGYIPNFVSIGNHEYSESGNPAYFQDYFSFPDNGSPNPDNRDLWYSFDYSNAHFVVVNSNYYEAGGDFSPGSEQYEWLLSDLQSADSTWKFIAFHHPPYVRSPRADPKVEEYLVPLFERYGVQAVFNGHIHFYERSRKRGIHYIVTGGGGGPLVEVGDPGLNPYSIYAESLFHHCQVDINGSDLSFFARDTDGEIFDSFGMNLDQDEDHDGYLTGDEYQASWDPSNRYSPAPAALVSGDYDGDGSAEVAIFRPATGLWAVRGVTRCYFGKNGDWPVAGDYSGDGTSEVAVFRADSGLWAIRGITRSYFGADGDIPVPGDYNGDGKADTAIFKPKTGLWTIREMSRFYLGREGDHPLTGDFDGDGTMEGTIFRMEEGLWIIKDITRFYFGTTGDLASIVDYTGDEVGEAAIFRSSSGLWAIRGVSRCYFGRYDDNPVSADYDGDGSKDIAIFRPGSGLWAMQEISRIYFGSDGDSPATR
ncbi:MAG: metallophosphoesterase family protein [Candidatus Euphemobacter frigidus]|nr:metallophosphoesterase family protein [Candidatus Euphemobacter frigidus]MDP8276418.1 metallophosphoesterase family protein [Candidatus Euphemobacter frigidus]